MKARSLGTRRAAADQARRSFAKQVARDMGRSRGVPLAPGLRTVLEPSFGHDFAKIRIHSDDPAARASETLGAAAFAAGSHLFFAPGRFRPESKGGRRLLLHELAHSVQQGGQSPFTGEALAVTTPGGALEREAEAATSDVSAGRHLAPGTLQVDRPSARGVIGRFAIFALAFEHLLESVDPALTLQRVAIETLQIFESEPLDRAGRVRNQLGRLDPQTRAGVMERIHARATADQWSALNRLLADSPPPGAASADIPADNIIPLPVRSTPAEPASGSQPPGPRPVIEPGAETEAKPTAKQGLAGSKEQAIDKGREAPTKSAKVAEEPEAVGPKVPQPQGVPEVEKPAAPGLAPTAAKGAAKAGAAPPGGPPAVGAGGTETADVSAAEHAGLPTAADAERQPPPGAVTAPAETPELPRPAPQPEPVPAAAEAGPALPASESAAAAELESVATSEESSGPGPAPAGAPTPAPEATPLPAGTAPRTAEAGLPPAGAAPPAMEASQNAALPVPMPAETSLPPTPPPETAAVVEEAAPTAVQPREGSTETPPSEPASPAETQAGAPGIAVATPTQPLDAAEMAPAAEAEESAAAENAPPAAPTPAEAAPAPSVETPMSAGAAPPEVAATTPTLQTGAEAQAPPTLEPAPEPEAALGPAAPAPAAVPAQPQPSGICAMVAPAPEPDAGGEGGGACGGGAAAAEPTPPAPESAPAPAADPVQAVGQAAGQSPTQVQQTMCGAATAANDSVDNQQQELAASPPAMDRPSGAPADKDGAPPPPPPAEPAAAGPKAVERVPAGEAVAPPPPAAIPALPPSPVNSVRAPAIPGESQIDERAAAQVQEAVHSLPVSDPGLNVNPGQAPQVELTGDADPAQGKQQREKLDQSAADAKEQGKHDAAQALGEDNVYPRVPKETLTSDPKGPTAPGDVPACSIGAGSGGDCAAKEAADDPAAIVAQEQRGDQINASVAQARQDMVKGEQDHSQKVDQAKSDNQRQMDEEVQKSAQEQTDARSDLRKQVGDQRQQWTSEQRDLSDKAQTDSDKAGQDADGEVTRQQRDANADATGHYDDANKKIATERENAEKKAAEKRQEGEQQSSGGLLSKIGSAVSSFFEGIKNAINAVFDLARKAVKAAIETAQKLASAVIDKARGLIVAAIHKLGDALIAIGDHLLAGFPALRDKFRSAVHGIVAVAEKVVNAIADKLKKGVQALLNLLGKVLDAYLCVLRAVYLAAVDAVQRVVKGALDFAKAVVQGFAAFAQLIKDIAAGPGDWLRKLGRAVVDGIKNCLWSAFKRAVKEWFNSKLEEVLGLGLLIVRLLCQGGISFAKIGKMAWEGLKSAIPGILIQILIEKLVSMIVPAAGAILTIIEGLRAAWGTISRILRAFELFFKFLKAVKGGNAAGPFADAVAAAAIVVIDFVANWLIGRLKRPAGAISGRLKGMADAFKRMLGGAARVAGRVVRAVGRGLRAVGRGFVRGVKAIGRGLRTAGRFVGRGLKRAAQWFGKTKVGQVLIKGARKFGHWAANTRVGKALIKAGGAIRRKYQQVRNWGQRKWAEWREKRRERKEQSAADRLERATARAWPIFRRLASLGTPEAVIKLAMAALRAWYRLSRLELRHRDNLYVYVHAEANPEADSPEAFAPRGEPLRLLIHEVAGEIQERRDVQRQRAAQSAMAGTEEEPRYVQPGAGTLASSASVATRAKTGVGAVRTQLSTTETEQLVVTQVGPRGGRVGRQTRTGRYPEMAEELQQTMHATGLGDAQFAQHFQEYVKTHDPSSELRPHVDQLNRLHNLMLAVESERSIAGGTAFGPMAVDLIAKGGGQHTFNQMFAQFEGAKKSGGGFYPMSMLGAETAADDLRTHGLRGVSRLPSKRAEAAKELARRETGIAEAWVYRLMEVAPEDFATREGAKRRIKSELLAFYGLT
jgi:hypothetical protein